MDNNLILYSGSIVAVNLDWVDPTSKIIITLIAVGSFVMRVLEYRKNNRKK